MMRLLALLAILAPAAFGSDIGRQSPCYMSGAFVDCYQPVEHTSMEGPAAATVSGYLASVDWVTFNGKDQARTVGNLTEATSAVLTITSGSGAVIGSGTTIQVTKAAAAANGYLGSADWTTFNSRQAAGNYVLQSTTISTTSPLAGGGDLSAARTLSIPAATASVNGYLASGDWATFNGKGAGTVTSVTGTAPVVSSGGATPAISMPAATITANGYLASGDWVIFNNRVATNRAINTTSPLAGGGALSADLTLSLPVSTAAANGYLASSDWATFNGKDQARTVGNLTEATSAVLTITSGSGAVIGSGTTIQVTKAAAAANGYLGSADWTTFNGGGGTPATLTMNGYLSSADWKVFNAKQGPTTRSWIGNTYTGSTATCNTTPAGTFGTFSTGVTSPSITAPVTGTYMTFSTVQTFNNTNSQRSRLQLVATTGSPTSIANTQAIWDDGTVLTNLIGTYYIWRLDTLTAGSSYVYSLECSLDGGTVTLRGDTSTNGIFVTTVYLGF